MLPRKNKMTEVATLLADGPLLEDFHIVIIIIITTIYMAE